MAAGIWIGQGNTLPIGAFDPARVAIDYEMVAGAFNINAYDPATAFTNAFIVLRKSGRITPLDGLAFLTSAIKFMPPGAETALLKIP